MNLFSVGRSCDLNDNNSKETHQPNRKVLGLYGKEETKGERAHITGC